MTCFHVVIPSCGDECWFVVYRLDAAEPVLPNCYTGSGEEGVRTYGHFKDRARAVEMAAVLNREAYRNATTFTPFRTDMSGVQEASS